MSRLRSPHTAVFTRLLPLAPLAGLLVLLFSTGCPSASSSDPEPSLPPEPVVRTARLVFIGDVMSHSPQLAAARADAGDLFGGSDSGLDSGLGTETAPEFDYTEVFRHVRPIFESADVVVANLETTLRTTPPYTGYPTFAAPAQLAFAMRSAGVDIATVANNHTCDKGARGIRSTLAILDSAGVCHTGAFLDSADRAARNPLRFTAGGLHFALLTYTYGTNGIPVPRGTMVNLIDTALIAADLREAHHPADGTPAPDCIIVSYHWGDEYRHTPNPAQRLLAAWTRAHGADIVMGGHPHVVEPFEAHYNPDSTAVVGATYYSLGNFVSNQRRRYTDGGMMAQITVRQTDSLPAEYDLAYRLFWVHTPVNKGVMRYRVLPVAVADTMLVSSDAVPLRPDAVPALSADTTPTIPDRATGATRTQNSDRTTQARSNQATQALIAARRDYDRFISDTRRLLAGTDSVFVEKF